MILWILLLALIGIAFTLYKTRVRILEGGPLTEEPEQHHPIAHIKSVLFLEVPLERIVMGYFAVVFLGYLFLWTTGTSIPEIELGLWMLSGIILLILIFTQILVAGIADTFRWRVLVMLVLTAIVFWLIWQRPGILEPEFLLHAETYTITVHLLGLVLGLGGALILDVMIFHFLNNLTISSREAVIMHLISQMIILGLALLIVSGFALTLISPEVYLENPRFLMKMTAVGVVTINGVLLNLFVVPKMEQISFQKGEIEKNTGLIRGAFVAGAVSMISWLSVFILAMINPLEAYSFETLLAGYLVLLAVTVAGGLIMKKVYERKAE
ncbi:MAG: hypothetical protein EA390_00135 [Balneolaceae bacterium]|nr:MAG: hypothetical protein EA390_00135 [Balneolaceae bacterium]